MQQQTILIVDDVPKNIQMAMNILKNEGYKMLFAQSGKKAFEIIKANDIDLILLGVMMPELNGFEVCQILKKDENIKNIHIIFLTAKHDENSISKSFELGAVDYITKPFFSNELQARVKTHLELKSYRDNLLKELELKDKIMLQQNKMATMGEMLENIAHQWRQPLSVITTASSGVIFQKDSAGGIDDSITTTIFNPYFTTKEKTGGTGIGLYMSEKIITNHFYGTISTKNVDFKYNNKNYFGAEFAITLPLNNRLVNNG